MDDWDGVPYDDDDERWHDMDIRYDDEALEAIAETFGDDDLRYASEYEGDNVMDSNYYNEKNMGDVPKLDAWERDENGAIIDPAYHDSPIKVSSVHHPRDEQATTIRLLKAKVEQLKMQLASVQAAADEVTAINRMLRTTNEMLTDTLDMVDPKGWKDE